MGHFIETYRGAVQAWECDHLGHMNVQFYIARVSDAAWTVSHALGLTPSVSRDLKIGLAAVRYEAEFRRELRPGDLIHVETGVRAIGRTSLGLINRLFESASGDLAMELRSVGVCLDLETRKARPLPDFVRERAATLLVGEDR